MHIISADGYKGVIRVMVVDDQDGFRRMARIMFEVEQEFTVIGEARDGDEAVEVFSELSPDVVLMDVQMPRMNGFDATRRIVESESGAAVVLISMDGVSEYSRMASEVGAVAFMPKRELTPESLLRLLADRGRLPAGVCP